MVEDQFDVLQRKAEFALTVACEAPPPAMATHVDARHVLQGMIDKARIGIWIFVRRPPRLLAGKLITLFAGQDIEAPGRARDPVDQDHLVIHVGSASV